jgi:hypothetical protein
MRRIMGLDQYAYVATRSGQQQEYYDTWNDEEDHGDDSLKPRKIANWRKHPNLQGWMEQLWLKKNPDIDPNNRDVLFNGVELELTWNDLEELEQDVQNRQLPPTQGFFFGNNADEYYYKADLEFIKKAKAELFLGLKVFYNSSW